jgi:CRP/FNR family transcriptional regulator, cyclic AMP receptor protein
MMTMSRASPPAPASAWPMNAVGKLSPEPEPEACLADVGVGGRVVRLEEGVVVFLQGDPADAVFYVRKGRVKLTVVSNTGKEAVLGIASEGEFVGASCLTGARAYIKTATAMVDCELLRIDRDVMKRALHRNDALAALFVERLLSQNVRAEADLVDQLLNSSEKRLARALLLLAHVGDETMPVTLKISQETLAQMVGTTRSRVNEFMNRFRDSGFVDYDRDGLHVHRSLLDVVLRPQGRSEAFRHKARHRSAVGRRRLSHHNPPLCGAPRSSAAHDDRRVPAPSGPAD